jgi:NADH-quinone oxidoreductase subunit N
MGGMFYKLALFPFHFWCPDVYQGASNETAGFVATLPKLGAVVVLVRLAALLKPGLEITTLLAVLGAVSMTFGNLCALAQKDVKRLLGFSSVAHAGYIMVGLVAGTAMGLSAAAFYALAYVAMNLLCFWVISRVATDGRNLQLDDLNGLYKRSPGLAFALGVGAFALVGLPPTMGFMGKFFLIAAAWDHGYNWLVITLVLNSAIAIFYYLSLVRHAYTHEAGENAPVPDNSPFSLCGAGILAAVVLVFGMVPGGLFDYAVRAGQQLLP